MAETNFNEFNIPSVMGAGYTTEGLEILDTNNVVYEDGGYCQIGNIVIVMYRFKLSNYTGGLTSLVSGFPLPLRPNGMIHGYLSANRPEIFPFINGNDGSFGFTAASTSVPNNTVIAVCGVYISSTASQPMLQQHNYNINLLTYGVPLTAGADVNNLNVPGVYTVRSATGISNLPEGAQWGRLEVIAMTRQDFSFTSEGRIGQLWTELYTGDLYYRYWNGSMWKDWVKKYGS